MDFNIIDYGALGDGKSKDTEAIQKTINACNTAGGGRVVLPAGRTYYSGSIELKSNVDFHIESGAVLKASEDLSDYREVAREVNDDKKSNVPSYINCEYNGRPYHYFIYANKAENIRITGFGTIDGSEHIYYGKQIQYHIEGSYYPRIPMILVEEISHLTVKDITLTRCGFWTLHMAGCKDVLVDGIRILNNLKMANCDGIDPDHCENVRITNCHIECADDCIVLKNSKAYEKYGPCKNIHISGCTLVSTSSTIKIGTESESDFQNIVITNCTISKTNRGVSIQLRDKGNVENVIISDLNIETRRFSEQWWGRAEPIYITVFDRKKGVTAGQIKNVKISNINCKGENGIFISGSKDHVIRDLSMSNINVLMEKTSKWPCDSYDIRPCTEVGIIPSKLNGVYADYVDGLEMSNVSVTVNDNMKEYYGQEYKVVNVKNYNSCN